MFRITTIFLCILLAAAAVGRYRAEQSVQKTRMELERLETARLDEVQQIQLLRAEVAYLENPERLAKIARAKTDLRPSEPVQMVSVQQFSLAMTGEDGPQIDNGAAPSEIITNAIAMVQLSVAE
jgi:cell division protein FtsL